MHPFTSGYSCEFICSLNCDRLKPVSAIYQTARPLHWEEVVGQEHVRDVLMASFAKGRIGHAYLFSGPRGVGKTTTARLIAMTVNCEGEGSRPCGVCSSCQMVKQGSHPDVFEIDAASNNSVDDVRELREKVNLASMYGGKKIYILDEAHMMSKAAFNALLKTLEEPPEHVIFILATTEPERIIPTILSRCQHYRFRRLSDQEISGKLERLCTAANISYEPAALALMGRLADGAMRDGESLLERMFSTGQAISLAAVEQALGLPPAERLYTLATGIIQQDSHNVLAAAGQLYREGFAARTVIEQTKVALRQLLHLYLGLLPTEGQNMQAVELEPAMCLRVLAVLDAQDSRFAQGSDLISLELALTHALLATEPPRAATVASALTISPSQPAASSPDPQLLSRLSQAEEHIQALQHALQQAIAAGVGRAPAHTASQTTATSTSPNRSSSSTRTASNTSAPSQNWKDVLQQADVRLRAFLKMGHWEQGESGYQLVYASDKVQFHGEQAIKNFETICQLVRQVFGEISFELITAKERKRYQGARNSTISTTPEPAATTAKTPADIIPEVIPQVVPPTPPPTVASNNSIPDFDPMARGNRKAAPSPRVAASPTPPPVHDAASIPSEEFDSPDSIPIFDEPPLSMYDDGAAISRDFPPSAAPSTPEPKKKANPVTSAPAPSAQATSTQATRTPAASSEGSDLLDHPNYQQLRSLLPHKIRERGKLSKANLSENLSEDSNLESDPDEL